MVAITDIYFVGGFGTVTWIDTESYQKALPDLIVQTDVADTLRLLNDGYATSLVPVLSHPERYHALLRNQIEGDDLSKELAKDPDSMADSAKIISIDKRGLDVRLRYGNQYVIRRVKFSSVLATREEAAEELERLTTLSGGHVGVGGIDLD